MKAKARPYFWQGLRNESRSWIPSAIFINIITLKVIVAALLPYAKTSARKDKVAKTPFTPEQTSQIIAWCDEQLNRTDINPLHPLGIKFGLKMGECYGELRKNLEY